MTYSSASTPLYFLDAGTAFGMNLPVVGHAGGVHVTGRSSTNFFIPGVMYPSPGVLTAISVIAPTSVSAAALAPSPVPTGSVMVTLGALVYPVPKSTTLTAVSFSVVFAAAGPPPSGKLIGSNWVPLRIERAGAVV